MVSVDLKRILHTILKDDFVNLANFKFPRNNHHFYNQMYTACGKIQQS